MSPQLDRKPGRILGKLAVLMTFEVDDNLIGTLECLGTRGSRNTVSKNAEQRMLWNERNAEGN